MEKPHKKRSLVLYSTSRNASDYQSQHSRSVLPDTWLTDFFAPLYKYTFKGYGHNNPQHHTMTNYSLIHTGGTSNRAIIAGDLCAIECVAGRQVYMEFNALPLYNAYDLPLQTANTTGIHPSTVSRRGSYKGYALSLEELIERCMLYSRTQITVNSTTLDNEMLPQSQSGLTKVPVWSQFSKMELNDPATYYGDDKTVNRIDFELCYEGGFQEHVFTNNTKLPCFMEIREFMPKEPLNYRQEYGNFGVTQTVNGVTSDLDGFALTPPGLYETIPHDYMLQKKHDPAFDEAGTRFTDITEKFCDNLDDKTFKYNKFMKWTNRRWVVGDVVRHRIDPGQTFRYRMNLPAFKFKAKDVVDWLNYLRVHRTDEPKTYGLSSTEKNTWTPAFWPKFSKFVQIRVTGANGGWVRKVDNVAQTTWSDKDVMTGANHGGNNVFPNSDISDVAAPNPFAGTGAAMTNGDRTHVLSAPVLLLHTMTEHHNCRILPRCEPVHTEYINCLPNAYDKSNVTINDRMAFIDPVSNEEEMVV